MPRNLLVIINAHGGRTSVRRIRRVVSSMLESAEIPHEIAAPGNEREGRRLAMNARSGGFTEIVCVGGDGTVSLVAGAVAGDPLPLSIVPRGTGNILARHLGIPLELRRAIDLVIQAPPPVALDAIERDDGISLLNLSIGLSSLTMADVDTRVKRVLGTATYVGGVLLYLLRRNPGRFRIVADGTSYRFRAREVLVSNAGFRRTAIETFFADSRPDDGVIECSVFVPAGVRGAIAMIADVLEKRPRRAASYMKRIHVRESITIDSDPPLPIQADGDPIGFGRAHARLRRRAILVRAPGTERRSGWGA